MNNRRIIVLLIVFSCILIAAFVGIKTLRSYKLVTVQFAEGLTDVTARIYSYEGENHEVGLDKLIADQQPVKQLTSSGSFKLRQGEYVIIAEGVGYEQYLQPFELNEPKVLTVNLNYTPQKLAEMLPSQKAIVDNVITTTVPNFNNTYKLSGGKLYGQGEWYGAIIEPNISEEQARQSYNDRFGVVAKKDSKGIWRVITVPPEIILSSVKYPQIPRDLLIDLNNQTVPSS